MSETTLRIRPACAEDAPALSALLNAIIAIGGMTAMETPLDAAAFCDHFLLGAHCRACFVADDAALGRPIGFQALASHPDLPADWGDVATFAALSWRRRGLGTDLFDATQARARALGLQMLNAAIRADNAGGLAFYEKLGFRTYATLRARPLRDGRPVDRILKQYRLAPTAAA